MASFADHTVSSFLDVLASASPTPGGGAAAAVAGAMGTALLGMVAGLPVSRTGTDEERASLTATCARLAPLRLRLLALADEDAAAYDAVLAAFRLPKQGDDAKAARTAAIQHAFRGATETPLDTLRTIVAVLADAPAVAAVCVRSASSDAGVGIGLLETAAAAAAMNIRTNLGSVKDTAWVTAADTETRRLEAAVATHAQAARTALA